MRTLAILLVFALLQGCGAAWPNNIKETKSTFDGSQEVLMSPGFVFRGPGAFDGADFKIGAHWSSTAPDRVSLKAEIQSVTVNIQNDDGLQFNIDGEFVKLSSHKATTDFDTEVINGNVYKSSSRPFATNLELLDRLLNGRVVMVKLVTGGGYLEGELTADKTSAAIRGLREFRSAVAKHKGGRL